MARGRKKGGIDINTIYDKEELTSMIINQINSLNKKIKAFKNEGIDEQIEYVKNLISNDMGKFSVNDTLSKSKKFYNEKNTLWLKKTLSALIKVNNHEYYGTTKKYHKEVTNSLKKVQDFSKDYLREKGYNEKFIVETINSKQFLAKLYMEFSNLTFGYGSKQAIEKIALSYGEDTGFSDKEINKILNNIEYSRNTAIRLKEEQEAVNEILKMRNNAKR